MEIFLSVNRKCLRFSRPDYFYFMDYEVFPNMDPNAQFPDSAAKIAAIRVKFRLYGIEHAAKRTTAADVIYQDILTDTSLLMKYAEDNCDNNLVKLESSGFIVNKTKGTPEPLTGKVENVHSMALGEGRMKFEYESDEFAHFFLARIRLRGGTDADWVMNGRSENHTMIITTGLTHGLDYEIQICGNGTLGQGLWSDVKPFLVD